MTNSARLRKRPPSVQFVLGGHASVVVASSPNGSAQIRVAHLHDARTVETGGVGQIESLAGCDVNDLSHNPNYSAVIVICK